MNTDYYISTQRNANGQLLVFVARDQFGIELDSLAELEIALEMASYELEERIVEVASKALDKPIWLHHENTGECFIITRYGPIEELKELANGEFEIALEPVESINLNDVMTVSEVAQTFNIEASTIRRACINGWIPARKSAATWLMRREDVVLRWGFPQEFKPGDVIEFLEQADKNWRKAIIIKGYNDDAGRGYIIEPTDHKGAQIRSAWRRIRKVERELAEDSIFDQAEVAPTTSVTFEDKEAQDAIMRTNMRELQDEIISLAHAAGFGSEMRVSVNLPSDITIGSLGEFIYPEYKADLEYIRNTLR